MDSSTNPFQFYELYADSADHYLYSNFQASSLPPSNFDLEAPNPAIPVPIHGCMIPVPPDATFLNEPNLSADPSGHPLSSTTSPLIISPQQEDHIAPLITSSTPFTSGQPSTSMSSLIISPQEEKIIAPLVTSADNDQQMVEVSISTAFHPGSHSAPSDIVFLTTDSVLFYVNARIIQQSSRNAFSRILHALPITSPQLQEKVINVPDNSDVLNVILHCLYGTSFSQNSPSFDTLETAIDRMPFYSIIPSKHIFSGCPTYAYILTYAALHPIRVYALAAHHDLEEMAVVTSSHLLGVPLSSIHDDMANKIGALYLNRLVHFIAPRMQTLKNILLRPPMPHPATVQCTLEDQKGLTRAWAFAVAHLAWDARPDISTYTIRATLNPLLHDLSCEVCMEGLKDRIKNVVVEWAKVKRTI